MTLIACNTVPKNKLTFQWTEYATLPGINGTPALGYAGPATGIHNNELIIGGGANFPEGTPWMGGKKKYYSNAYSVAVNATAPVFKAFTLPYNVAYSANCSTPAGVICAGGEDENGPLRSVSLIQAGKDTLTFTSLTPLPVALTNAAAAAIGNNVYVAGGETKTEASSLFFTLNLNDTRAGWQQLPGLPKAVSHCVLISLPAKGQLFLAGGRRKTSSGISDLYNSLFVYETATGKWIKKTPLPYALSAGTGALIGDRYIALFGGDKGAVFRKTEQLISAISKTTNSTRRQTLIEEKKRLQITHPGFSRELLLYDIKNDAWVINSTLPFNAPATTTALKEGNHIWVPSGEIKAGVRTPKIWEAIIK